MSSIKDARALKEQILESAEWLFAQNGYKGTKMLAIAEKAGVNHALIHYYYSSKDKLFEEVVLRLFKAWEKNIKTVVWNDDNPTIAIREYIKSYFLFQCEYKNFYVIRKWDEMEGLGVFSKYINEYWYDDLNEKCKAIKLWQEKKLINSDVNPRILLFNIWELIAKYSKLNKEELEICLDKKGSYEELQQEIIKQISFVIINGIL